MRNSRESQSRAKFQSRKTVFSETCRTSEICFASIPPKNFSSTTLLLRGYIFVKSSSASSSASNSTAESVGQFSRFGQRKFLLPVSTALGRVMRPRVLDEDLAHESRGDAVKMRAILPGHLLVIDQLQIRFMHERGRLQGVIAAFALQVSAGHTAQFFVNEGH